MRLDRIVIEPRARSAWEAIDLGFLLARRWWRELLLAWALPATLLLCLLFLALPSRWWAYNALVIWWLKPLWDCAPLYIASRKLFGEDVRLIDAWRQAPRLLGREALAWLTWRRLSVSRSADLPVTLLEQLRGGERGRRLNVLHRSIGSGAMWLTVVCANAEMVVYFGVFSLVPWMLPDTVEFNPFSFLTHDSVLAQFSTCALTLLAAALVAPFYTMAGFTLYICRRIELEGWDIEIRFRHIAARAQGAARVLLLLIVVGGAGLLTTPAQAQTPAAATQPPAEEAHARIEQILHSPAFENPVKRWHWRLKDKKSEDEKDKPAPIPEWLIGLVAALEKLGGARGFFVDAAQLLRLALGLLLVAALSWLLYRYRAVMRGWLRMPQRHSEEQVPATLFGLDVRAETLPDDVPAQVLELWRAQQPRAALSLLYRATLAQLLARFALPFHSDHTEQECVTLVERIAPTDVAPFFRTLTTNWERLAYAHQLPQTAAIEQLCKQWREVFADAD